MTTIEYTAIEKELAAKTNAIMLNFHKQLADARANSGYYYLQSVLNVLENFEFTAEFSTNGKFTIVNIQLWGWDTMTITAI